MLDRLFHYWFLDGRLIGSENPDLPGGAGRIAEHLVRERGVRTMLTLTPTSRALGVDGLRQLHLPIDGEPTRAEVGRAVGLVAEGLERGGVWVHCQQGVDRTGVVIGSYLASIGHPPERVIGELAERFPERRRAARMVALWEPYRRMIRSFGRESPMG
ncbi:MAG TPA: tyrosine-protein phosphatase [Tepidisphaeraceae bacterium]|nr:tyrosine-protein phosphatase [Tepidisphaeraceae bacterium]